MKVAKALQELNQMSEIKPVAALLDLASNLRQLRAYVLDGSIADILVDPELMAAKDAFRKVQLAQEPRQQVWSAINHLESAHNRLKAIYFHRSAPLFLDGEKSYLFRLSQKDRYTLCFMACCYKALREKKLCEDALSDADAIDWKRYLGVNTRASLFSFFEPRFWGETARSIFSPQETVSVDPFRKALAMPRPASVLAHEP